jgi:hypothetical protein
MYVGCEVRDGRKAVASLPRAPSNGLVWIFLPILQHGSALREVGGANSWSRKDFHATSIALADLVLAPFEISVHVPRFIL